MQESIATLEYIDSSSHGFCNLTYPFIEVEVFTKFSLWCDFSNNTCPIVQPCVVG